MKEDKRRQAKCEFLISKYWQDGAGKWLCDKPKSLPCGGDGEACQVVIHEWRERKSGPGHRLMVVRCKTHGLHFTVYPEGYVPYGRVPVVPVRPKCDRWVATVFSPGVCDEWRREYTYEGGPSWQTLRRRLRYCGKLVGLTDDEQVGEAVAALLAVPLAVQVAARRRFACRRVDDECAALESVLGAVALTPRLWRQMLRVGRLTGTWGDAWEWTGVRLVPLFPVAESKGREAAGKGAESDP